MQQHKTAVMPNAPSAVRSKSSLNQLQTAKIYVVRGSSVHAINHPRPSRFSPRQTHEMRNQMQDSLTFSRHSCTQHRDFGICSTSKQEMHSNPHETSRHIIHRSYTTRHNSGNRNCSFHVPHHTTYPTILISSDRSYSNPNDH